MRAQQGTKSGFVQSRNAVKHKQREAEPKPSRALAKVERAREELAQVLMDEGDAAQPPVGGTLKKSATRFENEINKVRRLASNSNEDFNAEAANRAMLRAMYAATLDLIVIAETTYRREKKEQQGYVYVAMCNKAQELANDLRMTSNTEAQAQFIATSILHPIFVAQAQNMLSELMSLKSAVSTYTDPKATRKINERIDATMRTMGAFMTGASEKTASNIRLYLNGDMSFVEGVQEPSSKPKKRRRS